MADLQQIFDTARAKLAEKDQAHISADLVSRIRTQFLYLIDKDDGIYWMTFANALDWLEETKEGDSLYEARNNFKKRFLKLPSIFLESRDDKDFGRHYTIVRFTKPEMEARKKIHAGKEASLKSEITFSTEGFKLFCISQSSTKSQAVWLYFLEIEKDYHRVLHAAQAEIIRERDALKARNLELEKAQGDRPMAEFLTDAKTTALIARIETDRQALEVEVFKRTAELEESQKTIYVTKCEADEANNASGLRSAASTIIRSRYLKYKFDMWLINPEYIKKRRTRKPDKPKAAKRPAKKRDELQFSSDSDIGARDVGTREVHQARELREPDEYVLYEGDHTSECYLEQFPNMSALDLNPESSYFFAISPKDKPDKFDRPNAKFICELEFSNMAEVRHAITLLGPPILTRPNKIYLTSYETIRSCADQAICDLANPAGPKKKSRAIGPISESDSAESDSGHDQSRMKTRAERAEAKIMKAEALRMERTRIQEEENLDRLKNLRTIRVAKKVVPN